MHLRVNFLEFLCRVLLLALLLSGTARAETENDGRATREREVDYENT